MLRTPLALALLALSGSAQNPCEGNGLGVTIAVSPAYLGDSLSLTVTIPVAPVAPGGPGGGPGGPGSHTNPALLAFSGKVGPVEHPLLGQSCLDVFAASFQLLPIFLGEDGQKTLELPLPADPVLIGSPPVFLSAAAFLGGQVGLSKTVPIWFAEHDAWFPAGKLSGPRGFLRSTALGDGPEDGRIGVFVSGGGDRSMLEPGSKADTWLFEPFTRTFATGPPMTVPRNFHTQTKLQDGRILITGGCDASGEVHTSAEIFDPVTKSIAACASMKSARSGHAATLLPDGRVLVSGGLSDFHDALTKFVDVFNTAQDTVELYDPAADAWTQLSTPMGSARTGHGHALWPDGRVMIVGGVAGAAVSGVSEQLAYAQTASWFDPATDSLAPAPAPSATAGFGLEFSSTGELYLLGGIRDNGFFHAADNAVLWFNGALWADPYLTAGLSYLPDAVAYATFGRLPNGDILSVGGLTDELFELAGSDAVGTLDFDCDPPFGGHCPATDGQALGVGPLSAEPAPRGAHAMVELFDGTFLVVGGMHGSSATPVGTWALDDAWIYAP